MTYYLTVLILYMVIGVIASWGLNFQFGDAGVLNFAYIAFFAAGAYTTGILTLGPAKTSGFQHYFWGTTVPWPLTWICAAVVGAVLSLLVGLVTLRRLRGDYQAMVLLVVSLTFTFVVDAVPGFLGGSVGLASIPPPLKSMDLHVLSDRWLYIVIALIVALIVLEMLRRIMSSPMGRVLRAVRDNPEAAAALGKNTTAVRLKVMMVGGSIAALAGSLQVQLIGAYSTAGWTYTETFIFFAAVIVGGRGNLAGVALGGILVPGLFFEGTVLLPNLPQPELVGAVQWITTGALIVLFMWFRPQGVIPERRRRFSHRKTRRLGFRAFDNVVRRLVQGAG